MLSKKGKNAGNNITKNIANILIYFIDINLSIKWKGKKYYSGTICLGVTNESLGKLLTGLSKIYGLKQTKYIKKVLTIIIVIKSFSIKSGYERLYLIVAWNALDGTRGVFSVVCITYKCK